MRKIISLFFMLAAVLGVAAQDLLLWDFDTTRPTNHPAYGGYWGLSTINAVEEPAASGNYALKVVSNGTPNYETGIILNTPLFSNNSLYAGVAMRVKTTDFSKLRLAFNLENSVAVAGNWSLILIGGAGEWTTVYLPLDNPTASWTKMALFHIYWATDLTPPETGNQAVSTTFYDDITLISVNAPYTVLFNAGTGSSTASLKEPGIVQGITLPAATPPAECENWTFAGWTTAAVLEETTTAPTPLYLAATNYRPSTVNITLYAVYEKEGVYLSNPNNLTGIGLIGVDSVLATRYYNLQGVEVKQPAQGNIYIVKKFFESGQTCVDKQVIF